MVEGWQELADADQRCLHIAEPQKAWLFIWQLTRPGDAVLVKGSRAMKLEEVVETIAEHVTFGRREEAA